MARHYKEYSDRCPNGSEILAEAEQEAKLSNWVCVLERISNLERYCSQSLVADNLKQPNTLLKLREGNDTRILQTTWDIASFSTSKDTPDYHQSSSKGFLVVPSDL